MLTLDREGLYTLSKIGAHDLLGVMVQGVNGIAWRRLSPPSPPGSTSQSTPIAGPELGLGSGSTGTCAGSPRPPYA
jgi:hypothetical protein